MRCDVAIVGAGPGGSTSARYLAKAGYHVILIDKDIFPRDKPCGGGFSYSILNRFPYLKKREREFIDGISRVGVIHSPNRKITLKGEVDMAVALRIRFDNSLLEEALELGVTPCLGTRVKSVSVSENNISLMTSDGSEIIARSLIGADGVNSLIAREAKLHQNWKSKEITVCRVVEIPAPTQYILETYGVEKEYHFFANFDGKPGYGWIFPKAETINVGLGIVGPHSAGLPKKFDSFIRYLKHVKKIPDNSDLSGVRGALVPTAGTIDKTFALRLLLVGDSAGMVSPITGGGIDYAMRAGRIAAMVLTKCMEKDTLDEKSLSVYQKLWYDDFGHEIKPQKLAQRILTSPLTDTFFEIGKRDSSIQKMVTDAMSETIDTRPQVFKMIARTLLVCLKGAFHL